MRPTRGVALVLVLAVTGVLALLIVQIGLNQRSHVAQAQRLLDRSEASLKLYSVENAVLYSMLTRERNANPVDIAGDNPFAKSWNFSGAPFEVGGNTIRLQDLGGLFALPLPGESTEELRKLLIALGFNSTRASEICESLERAMSDHMLSPLQSLKELAVIARLSQSEVDKIADVSTIYPVSSFNPQTAPDVVLATRYPGLAVEGLRAARRTTVLDGARVSQITGEPVDELLVNFLVGPGFRIDVTVKVRGVQLRRQSTWTVRPSNEATPLRLWGYRELKVSS